jgi:uncharacterized membrane protein YhfC
MSYAILFLNVALMIFMPVVLARFVAKWRKASWTLFAIGAGTFIASQVGHIPFNFLVLQRFKLIPTDSSDFRNLVVLALFLGVSAGIFEEVARYLTYRYWADKARSWGQGLMLGAGHGGIEAILVGVLVAINYVALARMRSGSLLNLVPQDQLPLVKAQIEALFSAPWYLIILGAVERLFALCFHLAASLMVMQVFVRKQRRWLFASILWHTLLNATAVIAVATWGAYVTEALIGFLALVSLGIVFWLRTPEPEEPQMESLPEIGPMKPMDLEMTAEMLDRSRYT